MREDEQEAETPEEGEQPSRFLYTRPGQIEWTKEPTGEPQEAPEEDA